MSAGTERRRVLVDCDPGHDDAIAILLAARHLDLAAITTVGGNQSVEKVTHNALSVLALGGITRVPVAAGHGGPRVGEPQFAGRIHGQSGLDGAALPAPVQKRDERHAVDLMAAMLAADGPDTLVALGPLTNVAAALAGRPGLKASIREISLMGGSFGPGNVTPAAEFNVGFDPEAAADVFGSGIPIRMCGLNLTRQAAAGDEEIEAFRQLGNRVGETVSQLVRFYRDRARELYGVDAVPLHDACAVAALIDPTLIEFQEMHVAVELAGSLTRGMTVCDGRFPAGARPESAPQPNALVGMKIDRARFFELLFETLASY